MDIQMNSVQETLQHKETCKKPRKKRGIIRKILLVTLLLILFAFAGFVIYSRLKSEYTIKYQSYNAIIGSISNSLSFSGTLKEIDSTTYTAPSATTIKVVYVKSGQDVQEGCRLMRLANGTIIEADFDGRVNQLYVAEGDKVASGDELIQIVDFQHMEVNIRVDEYDISDVKKGDAVNIITTATEKTFDSVIDDINYVSSSTGSVAYYTATAFVDVSGDAYPGMQVTVTIPKEEASNVVILKEEAISFDEANQAFVYVQGENGEMEQIYIKTGVSNGKYVEITEGLKDGDTVYAVAKNEDTSNVNNLLAGLFGGQQLMGGEPQSQGFPGGRDMPDFGNGERPSRTERNNNSNGGGKQ